MTDMRVTERLLVGKRYERRIASLEEHMLWAYWAAHPEQMPASWIRAAQRLREIVMAGPTTADFANMLRGGR